MSKRIEKKLAQIEKRIDKLEQHNLPTQPSDEQIPMEAAQDAHEAAQDAHEAAEVSLQTKRLDKMNVSLNSAPLTEAQVQELLREEKKQKKKADG